MRGKVIHWVALLTVPLLFLFFVARYNVLHARHDLSPGVGGGLSVFSDLDTRINRSVRVLLLTEQGDIPVRLPSTFDSAATDITYLPDEGKLSALAGSLLQQTWVPTAYNTFVAPPTDAANQLADIPAQTLESPYRTLRYYEPDPGDLALAVQGIRLELLTLQFDADTNSLTVEPLLVSTVTRNSDGN